MLRSRAHTVPPPAPYDPKSAAKRLSSLGIVGSPPPPEKEHWEVRPGGMLVQKREETSVVAPPPPIRVRVKYGAACHEIRISPEATFGDLKKMMSSQTGLHPQDMKVLFKDRERDAGAFLDNCGVKDRSKVVLLDDPTGKARRFLEMRKNAKMEKANKDIDRIRAEVDKLAGRVTQLDGIISKGKNVADSDVHSLIEQLMNFLIELDGIIVEGDVKIKRGQQVRRIQKYVETLDLLKVKNSVLSNGSVKQQRTQQQKQYPFPYSEQQAVQNKPLQHSPAVATMRWEPFDLLSSVPPPPTASSSSSTSTTLIPTVASGPRFNWELF